MAKVARSSQRRPNGPLVPSARDSALAAEARRVLATRAKRDLRVTIGARGATTVVVPAAAVQALVVVLTEFARGSAVTIVPVESELTTQQAADVLGVSRPFLVKELDAGTIPARMVGTHRRIRLEDLTRYRAAIDAKRQKALGKLAEQAQDLNMGS